MISVAIEYRPIEFIPWMRRVEKNLPSNWSEMNARQIVAIPDIIRDDVDESRLLEIFLGVKRSIARKIVGFQRYSILKNLLYVQYPEPLGYFVIDNIAGFNAPGDKLKGVIFGAFIFGETYYQKYIQGNIECLDKFIACYYTGKDGFNESQIETRAALISKWPMVIREAIGINYSLIREWLAVTFPYVFQKQEGGEKKETNAGWVKVFDAVVGKDIIHQDNYARVPAMEMLRFLNNNLINYYKNGGQV